MLTWVNIAFADDIVSLDDISSAAKLSAMETTTKPARTIATQIITALTVIGMSMAIADPFDNPNVSIAFATRLQK